jgi:mono/diheme cytochrome c family protein
MKPLLIGTFSIIASFALASAGVPEGKALFASKCQACHGPNGEGKPAIAKMFNVTMPPLGSKEIQSKSDADIKKIITTGQGKMKPIAGVTEEQASDIVSFVRTLKQ